MSKVCDICKKDIQKHQGYHQTGNRIVHSACEAGQTPTPEPRYPREKPLRPFEEFERVKVK